MAPSVALLQVQADQERRLPQRGAKKGAALRRAPTQDRQAGATRTPRRTAAFPPAQTPAVPIAPTLTFQPDPVLTPVHRICETMAGVSATAPNPRVPRFPGILALLEERAHTTPRLRLEILATLPLGERPLLVLCLEAPEPHIRVLWGTQFVTPSFVHPTLYDRKVLAFARDIHLGLLPATVVLKLEWLTLGEVTVPRAADMEALLSHLAPRAPSNTPRRPQDQTRSQYPGRTCPPPLSGPRADGIPFPGTGYSVAHDALKIRRHGDDPAGGTITRLVEGGNGGAQEGNCRPNYCGPGRRHPDIETGDQDEPRPPTTSYPTPKPNPPAAAPISDASAGPTVSTREAGSDAKGEVGSRTTQPPPSLKRKHSGTAAQLTEIYNTIAPLKKDQAQVAMKAA